MELIILICLGAIIALVFVLDYSHARLNREYQNTLAQLEGLQAWHSLYLKKTSDVPGETLQDRIDYLVLLRDLLNEEHPHAQ